MDTANEAEALIDFQIADTRLLNRVVPTPQVPGHQYLLQQSVLWVEREEHTPDVFATLQQKYGRLETLTVKQLIRGVPLFRRRRHMQSLISCSVCGTTDHSMSNQTLRDIKSNRCPIRYRRV